MEAHPSEHAEQRLFERFNLVLDDALTEQLAAKIDAGASALLGFQDNARELHAVEIAGRTVVAVWEPSARIFITFLHPDEFRGRLKDLGSSPAPKTWRRSKARPLKIRQPRAAPVATPKRKPPCAASARDQRKLAKQKAHEASLARRAEWVEQMAERQLRTRKAWVLLGRGIAPGAKPEVHQDPTHPLIVKLYHITATILQHECVHEWCEGNQEQYCLLCQVGASKARSAAVRSTERCALPTTPL